VFDKLNIKRAFAHTIFILIFFSKNHRFTESGTFTTETVMIPDSGANFYSVRFSYSSYICLFNAKI